MTGARWTALLASSYQLIRHQIQEFDQTPTLQNFFYGRNLRIFVIS
jgi:hypothetical protein